MLKQAVRTVLVLGWLSLWPHWASAQLGATADEMAKLYGPIFRHNARIYHRQIYDGSELDGDIYRKSNLCVRATFRRGKIVLLEFSKIDDALKQTEVDTFLSANAEGSRWEAGKDSTLEAKFYHRQDGRAIAQWAIGYDGSLLISAEEPNRLEQMLLP